MSGGESNYVIFLLQMLKEEWDKHRNLKAGASSELQQLRIGLRDLETFLRSVEKVPEKNDHFNDKKSDIRELVYDVQDTIEMYFTHKAATKTKHTLSQLWENVSTEMEEKVKNLKERVQSILQEIETKFGKSEVNEGSTSSLEKQPPKVKIHEQNESKEEASPQEDQKHIVDFQDEDTILNSVLERREKLDVIAITGTAGLGKTTFARKIFEHKDVVALFPLRIWVGVSEKFNSIETFRKIWKSLTALETSVEYEELIDLVRLYLETSKELLIVTDDVWTKKDWEEIQKIFPTNNGTLKVLVTTRQTDVAEVCCSTSKKGHKSVSTNPRFRLPYKMQILKSDKSLELLIYQIYDELRKFDDGLEDIGKVIAEKCRGVPLMILVIGGILRELYFEDDRLIPEIKTKWGQVSTNLDEFIGKDENSLILKAVELSYKRLDHVSRLCFLYAGLFPENHDIPASTLTQLWIAEGFVALEQGKNIEKNADTILKTLIKMNLVEAAKKNLGQVKTCKVHDMVRVFCRNKAEKENLFRVIKTSNEGHPPTNYTVVHFRRLCFDVDPSNFPSGDHKSVRSFLCFSKGSKDDTQKPTVPTLSNLLRILNCRSIRLKQFPEVKGLLLLKHVTLFIENLKYLPEEIVQLINLQTLIVGTDSGLITVKANILKMARLRRLKTKAAIFLGDKNWKGEYSGNQLRTITRLSPESCKAALYKKAPNLTTLGVRGQLEKIETTADMKTFYNVENLKLVNTNLGDTPNPPTLTPTPMVFTKREWLPPNLRSLALINTHLKWSTHLPLLAEIKSLEVLKLKDNAFTGPNWGAKDGVGFPNLKFLLMENLKLVSWVVPDAYFPILRSVVIKICDELRQIPENLSKHLESVEIERVRSSVVDSAKIIAKEQIMKLNQNRPCEVAFKLTIDQLPFSVTMNANSASSSSGQDNDL